MLGASILGTQTNLKRDVPNFFEGYRNWEVSKISLERGVPIIVGQERTLGRSVPNFFGAQKFGTSRSKYFLKGLRGRISRDGPFEAWV